MKLLLDLVVEEFFARLFVTRKLGAYCIPPSQHTCRHFESTNSEARTIPHTGPVGSTNHDVGVMGRKDTLNEGSGPDTRKNLIPGIYATFLNSLGSLFLGACTSTFVPIRWLSRMSLFHCELGGQPRDSEYRNDRSRGALPFKTREDIPSNIDENWISKTRIVPKRSRSLRGLTLFFLSLVCQFTTVLWTFHRL